MEVTRCGRVHAARVTTQITHQIPKLKAVEHAEQKRPHVAFARLAPNLQVTLGQTCAASSQSERASAPFCSNLKYTFMLLQVAKSMFLKMLEQPLAMAIPIRARCRPHSSFPR